MAPKFKPLPGAVACHDKPLHETLDRKVESAAAKSVTQMLADKGVWVKKDADTGKFVAARVAVPAAAAASVGAAAAVRTDVPSIGPAAVQWLARSIAWLEEEAPDWKQLDALDVEWSKLIDSDVNVKGLDLSIYNGTSGHVMRQWRINPKKRREEEDAKQRKAQIAARIERDRLDGKATWHCECDEDREGYDGLYDYVPPYTCKGCDMYARRDVDVTEDDEGFKTVVMTEEQKQIADENAQYAAEMAKRDAVDDEAKHDAAPLPFACVGKTSPAVPARYRTALDGVLSLERLTTLVHPLLVNAVRWLAEARQRVFFEAEQVFRWQCVAAEMEDEDTNIISDDCAMVMHTQSSPKLLIQYSREAKFASGTDRDYQVDRSEDNTYGPEYAQEIIIRGGIHALSLYELRNLKLKSVSPSQMYAVGHKFREHYGLMEHEHMHVCQLAKFTAAVLCAGRPTDAMRTFVARVLSDSIPPKDPYCGHIRRGTLYEPHNRYYLRFHCGVV